MFQVRHLTLPAAGAAVPAVAPPRAAPVQILAAAAPIGRRLVPRLLTLPVAPDSVVLEPATSAQDDIAPAQADLTAGAASIDGGWRNPNIVRLYTLAGRATIVLTDSSTGLRHTYYIKRAGDNYRTSSCCYFVDLGASRMPVGRIDSQDHFLAAALSSPTLKAAADLFARWWSAVVCGEPVPDGINATHDGRCGCCHRRLTDPFSVEAGIGPECQARVYGVARRTPARSRTLRITVPPVRWERAASLDEAIDDFIAAAGLSHLHYHERPAVKEMTP